MTSPLRARRPADLFDRLVDTDPGAAAPSGRDAPELAELLRVVAGLRSVPAPTPRPDFVAGLRSRLLAEADTALREQPQRRPVEERLALPPRRHDRRLAVALGTAALVGATGSMAVAARTALPGDSLYAVKRALEDARAGLARGDADRGAALLAQAGDRLREVEAIAAQGPAGAAPATLEDFREQSAAAADALLAAHAATGDRAPITSLREFAGSSMTTLAALEDALPAASRDALVAAGELLSAIDARAEQACPSCGGGIGELPAFLSSLGRAPAGVATLIVATSESTTRGVLPHRQPDPTGPAPVPGQDVSGIEVPDLTVPSPTVTGAPGAGQGEGPGTRPPRTPTRVEVAEPVQDVTGLLTGAVPALPPDAPVVGEVGGVVGGVTETVDGTVGGATDGLQGTLDSVTGLLD